MAVKGLSHCVYTVITKTRSDRIFQASVVKALGSLCFFTQGKRLGHLTDVQNITAKRLSHCVYTVITTKTKKQKTKQQQQKIRVGSSKLQLKRHWVVCASLRRVKSLGNLQMYKTSRKLNDLWIRLLIIHVPTYILS